MIIDHRNYDAMLNSGATPGHSIYYNANVSNYFIYLLMHVGPIIYAYYLHKYIIHPYIDDLGSPAVPGIRTNLENEVF